MVILLGGGLESEFGGDLSVKVVTGWVDSGSLGPMFVFRFSYLNDSSCQVVFKYSLSDPVLTATVSISGPILFLVYANGSEAGFAAAGVS